MSKRATPLVFAFVLVLVSGILGGRPPATAEEPADPGREMVWDGYLFRDGEGRVRLGWPVVAMGVMAMPAHVVEGEVARRLEPLLTTVDDDHVFWNYDLEARGDGALDGIPRTLVRLRGRVTLERPDDPNWGSYQGGTRTMHDARLVSVEFLPETWLRRWGRLFRHRDSPFRIDLDRGTITEAELRAFAKQALAILVSMREVAPAGEAERRLTRTIDAAARIVDTHRKQTEWSVQRWLVGLKAEHEDLELPGLAALPDLPPTSVELGRLFLENETKQAFLEAVRKLWQGDLEALELSSYVEQGASTVWTRDDLGEIAASWSEEEYRVRRATTVRMNGR